MKTVRILAVSLLASLAMAGQAMAQQVVSMDLAQVMGVSLAGKDLRAKLKAIGVGMDNELKPDGASIKARQDALAAETKGKTEQQLLADAALKAKVESFARDANALRTKQALRLRDLEATEAKAQQEFLKLAEPVIQEVMKAKGAMMLIDANTVLIGMPGSDITAEVVAALDVKVKTVPVVRVNLPPPEAPKPAAQ